MDEKIEVTVLVSKQELAMRRRTIPCANCGRNVVFYENDFNMFVTKATCCHCRLDLWEGMRPAHMRHLRVIK